MAKLISVRNRDGWAWPGFRAGTHTLALATDLKDWRVFVRPTKVFFQKGTTLHEESRDVVTLSWELADGETVDSLQKWDPPEQARPPEKAKAK
jgi:hypothetical protein